MPRPIEMRRTALRRLIFLHREEYDSLKEIGRARYRSFKQLDANQKKDAARNDADRQIVINHYEEFKKIHGEIRMLHGHSTGMDVYFNKVMQMHSDGRSRRDIMTYVPNWNASFGKRELRKKYRKEYLSIVADVRRADRWASTIYTQANIILAERHPEEYLELKNKCKREIKELLDGLEKEDANRIRRVG